MAEKGNAQAQVKEIIKQLEDGMQELFTTEKFAEYLRTMSKFSHYSTRNVRLINMQMPGATRVAGYQAWQTKFGRYVKRGEKGIRILAPTPFTIKKEKQKLDPDTRQPILGGDGLPITEIVEERIPRFKVIPVFDVSQTDGKPLPELVEDLPGDVRHYELFMDALAAVSPLPLVVEPMEGKDGYCRYGEKVAVREGMGETQTVCAAVHEIGHAKLHDPTRLSEKEQQALDKKSKRTKEIEAEAVSYTVCQYYGIETSPNSFGYIATWSKELEMRELTASLDTIRKTAAELIEGIDAKFHELAKERGIDLMEGREPAEAAVEQPDTPAPAAPVADAPVYGEQTVKAAFDRLKPGDLLYLPEAQKPVQLIRVRESDILFVAPELAVEIPQPHEQVLKALRDNPKNRHLLEAADAELNPPAPAREEPEPQAAPALAPNQHVETIDGVDFVYTTVGTHQPDQAAPTPEKEYDLGFGHMGNGLTVWNRLEERDGDYVTVAHIGPDRSVTFYDDAMPESVRARIEHEARTSNPTVSATQDTPVFDTPPDGQEPERAAVSDPIKEADAFLDSIGGVGNLFGEPTTPPPPARETEAEAPAAAQPMPDPTIGPAERDQFGYTQADMLPVKTERALALFDQDMTVYMLSPDGTEAMVFERGEIEAHDGIFGVEASEWFECPEYRRMEAAQGEAARETTLINGEGNAYGIYQLKDGDELRYHRWTGLDQLQAEGNAVDRANYALAYTAPLEAGVDLDDLFDLHNRDDRPATQEMRSMSVSDVVVLRQDGSITSHYVDNGGFTELPSFLGVEQQVVQQTYSQPGNTPEQSPPAVPDGPSVAELEAQVNAGQTISLLDLAHAVNRERESSSGKGKPSILAQLQEIKKTAAQGEDMAKTAPKRDNNREV